MSALWCRRKKVDRVAELSKLLASEIEGALRRDPTLTQKEISIVLTKFIDKLKQTNIERL